MWAAVGANPLPERGILLFFGDHDDVNGCMPTGGCAVQYIVDTSKLRPASLPLEDFEPLACCGLDFYDTFELPDWQSNAAAALGLSKPESQIYDRIQAWLSGDDEAEDPGDRHVSKLFGWPDLVQRDLGEEWAEDPRAGEKLLLQIGWYHDGAEWQCWGPGGHVYFTLDQQDVAACRFGRAALEAQCT